MRIPRFSGGLSVEENMIFVCQPCNIKKRDMGLIQFMIKYELDAPGILRLLIALGKKV